MLSHHVMGWLALAVLWVNVALIVAEALRRRGERTRLLEELQRALEAGHLVRGEVRAGSGPSGEFASVTIEQLGRAMTVPGPRRILFSDRDRRSTFWGGVAAIEGNEVRLSAAPGWRLWLSPAASSPRGCAFDEAWPLASTFAGFASRIERQVRVGEAVWLWLDRSPVDGVAEVRLVAAEDPIALVRRSQRPLEALVLVALFGLAVVTRLALQPPAFGPVSTAGAALGLAFFLTIQPLGTLARDRARLPDQALVGGVWQGG